MNTSHLSKVDENLRNDLAEYGLRRAIAIKKAPVSFDKPNFFAIEERGSETEMVFSKDNATLVKATEEGMQLALVAPEHESFNMLLTRDFPAAVRDKDPETLREFLRRILEEA